MLRNRLSHRPSLDGIRAIAVLVIVLHHTSALLDGGEGLAQWAGGAFLGVDMFLVLSGFLITALLLQEQERSGRVQVLRFYGRRALRLLPALYFLLLVHGMYVVATGLPRRAELEAVLGAAFYYKNWIGVFDPDLQAFLNPGHGAAALVHLWSLSVEEQFYLVWPFVAIALLGIRRRTGVAVVALVVMLVAIVVHRWRLFDAGDPFGVAFLYPRTDVRADALIVGALLAVLWLRVELPVRAAGVLGTVGAVVVVAFIGRARLTGPFLWKGGFTIFAIAVALVILAALSASWPANRVLSWRPLVAVGAVSYGVYLWHLPVFDVVDRYGSGWPVPVRVVVGYGATAAVTYFSWQFIEGPFLRLKSRLGPTAQSDTPSDPSVASVGDGSPVQR